MSMTLDIESYRRTYFDIKQLVPINYELRIILENVQVSQARVFTYNFIANIIK